MHELKLIGLFFLALAGFIIFPSQSYSTPVFNSRLMMGLYEKLPEEIRTKIKEQHKISPGTFIIDDDMICENSKIIFRINQYNELDHLGLHVISPMPENDDFAIVGDYIERLILNCWVMDNHREIIKYLDQEKVEINIYGRPVTEMIIDNSFCSILTFNHLTPFNINQTSDGFSAKWHITAFNYIEIKFPNNFYTISGKDKYEIENELIRELMKLPAGQAFHIITSDITMDNYSDKFFIRRGRFYFGLAGISSDQFFYRKKSSRPVFDRTNIYESASNLFQNIIPSGLSFQIIHILYGDRKESYTLKINDFLSYFGKNHTIFVGWQRMEIENLIASVFIYNNVFEYSHLLIVDFTKEEIFKETGLLKATFYSFTPHTNTKKSFKN